MLDPKIRRVLVGLRYGIGDLVMELPVLRALRAALPRARITALGAFPATQLLDDSGLFDEVVVLQSWGFQHRWDSGPHGAEESFGRWLDERSFELFLDLRHLPPRLASIIWGRGVQSCEASEEAEQRALLQDRDGVAAIREAVRAGWGLHVNPDLVPQLVPPAERLGFAEEFFARRGLGSAAPLALSPVASSPLKQWPLHRLARLADEIMDELDQPLLVISGPQPSAGEELRDRVRHPDRLELVGTLHLLDLAALLSRCRAFVCNDTGLMHLAAAVGVPTLGIFGPTRASIFRPPGGHVLSAEPTSHPCPYRQTTSLHPPLCFERGGCLVEEGPCISQTPLEEVQLELRRLLGQEEVWRRTELWVA